MSTPQQPDEPLNPVEVERQIREISQRLTRGISIVRQYNRAWRDAKRSYDVKKALAYKEATGTIPERKATAELAVMDEREAMDNAKVEYDYARETADGLTKQLSALQSINKSVNQMYGAEKGFG